MDPRVTGLFNDYIHGDMPRHSFLEQRAVITGGANMANSVLALIRPNYAMGQQVRHAMMNPLPACHGKER